MVKEDLIYTRRVLEEYGDDTINSMKDILISNDKDATGNLIQSLKYNIVYNGDNLEIKFSMIDYGKYVDSGRKPGSFPPISSISKWAQVKGIPQSAVFPISKNIARFGIKPTPFFDSSIELNKNKLIQDLEVAYTKDITIYLQKQIDDKL